MGRGGFRLGSGRKTKDYELKTLDVFNLSMNQVYRALKDESIPILSRADIGMRFIAKHMPDKTESLSLTAQIPTELISKLIDVLDRNSIRRNDLHTNKPIEIKAIESSVDEGKAMKTDECAERKTGGTPTRSSY